MVMPTIGMVRIDPMPNTTIISPTSPSLSNRRSAKAGIFAAHVPIKNPLIRNSSDTDALALMEAKVKSQPIVLSF